MNLTPNQAAKNVIPGKILYINVCFPQELTPNDKYFVVVGFDERAVVGLDKQPLLLKINSESRFSQTNQAKNKCQFRLKKNNYPFLRGVSFLDCSIVWYMISLEEIIAQLTSDPTRIIGDILSTHENEIIRLTGESKAIIPHHKEIIRSAFESD